MTVSLTAVRQAVTFSALASIHHHMLRLQAFMAALEALGCLPKHGIVTLHNEGILYTTVKPQ